MTRNLIIIGIDPGTTTGIAILSLEGNVLFADSQKHLGLNELIKKIIEFGKPILIGTDKAKIPSLVEQTAAKIGARIVSPDEDLLVIEKRELVKDFNAPTSHASDALAAALFASQKILPIIEKVDRHIRESRKEHLKDKLLEYVLRHGLNIQESLSILEEKTDQSKIIKKVVEENKLTKDDYLKLFKKYKHLENELMLLQRHNRKLIIELRDANKAPRPVIRINLDKKILEQKEKTISFLARELKKTQEQVRFLRSKNDNYFLLLSRWNEFVVINKLKNLGMGEYERIRANAQQERVLFVENPSIVSSKVIELLKNSIQVLLVCSKPGRILQDNFSVIDIAHVPKKDFDRFIVLRKKDFEQLPNKRDFSAIIEDYQNKRDYMMSS